MSKPIPIWQADIQGGRLIVRELDRFREYCRNLTGPLEVVVRKVVKTRGRTEKENRYYWGVPVDILSEFFGYEKEETHEVLLAEYTKQRYGDRRPHEPPAKIVRSSKMTTVEFEDYMDWIIRWAAIEFAIMIPKPNEVTI
jgi:hypothetical protein